MRVHHSNKRQLRGAAKAKWLALKLVMALVVPLLASEVVLADLADGRFGPAQVFDVQRSPAFPVAGQPFTVSSFQLPNEPPGFSPYTIPTGGWIEFVQVSGDPSCSYSIELYNSDGTFNRQVHSEGQIYGLGQAGFLHVSGGASPGTGTFIANSGGFQIGDSFTYTPDTGLATCLETTSYPANPNPIDDPTTNYTVGGSLTGLEAGQTVVLRQGAETLSLNSNGGFTFPTPLADGSSYSVVIDGQPSNQVCDVTNGSGSISSSNVTNVSVSCVSNDFNIGGTVTGLSGSGLVLQNNGSDDLSIAANGSFTFGTALSDGSVYDVTVLTQPGSPSQTCTISNSSGTLAGADITDVAVNCITNTVTLSFDSAGGSAVDDITQVPGTAITSPVDPTRSGFTFAGWDPAVPATMPAANQTHTAQWNINSYTLSFDSAGGSAVADINQDFGTAIIAPTDPNREGYTFTGWSPALPTTMPATNQTHTAQWSINSYTISFDSAGGSAVADINQDFGTAITAPADPTREGYTFTGWSPEVPTTMPEGGLALTAQWSINSYTLSFDSAGGSAVADINQDFGTAVIAPTDPNREGYTFTGWSPALPTTMPAANQTHTAQWSINSYTISFDSAGGSAVADINQDFGTAITAPADPTREGHTFTGWSPEVPTTMPEGGLALTAQWSINSYTLSFDSAGGSAVADINQSFGTSVEAPTPTREGYTFTGWLPATPDTMPAEDQSFTAQWSVNQYTLTFDAGAGTVDPETETITFGSAVGALPVPTLADHYFKEWNLAADGSGATWTPETIYNITGPVTLYAQFFKSLEPELPDSTTLASDQPAEFNIIGSTDESEIEVLGITQTRQGSSQTLPENEMDQVLIQQGASFTFVASQTGRYEIEVRDSVSGEVKEITFDVLPYIGFSSRSQAANQGQPYKVSVTLSDLPIEYPVKFAVEASGLTVTPAANLTIDDETNAKVLELRLNSDTDAVLHLLESGIEGALFGTPNHHQLRYQAGILPLNARIEGRVNGDKGLVAQAGDLVELTASTSIAGVSYRWSALGHNTPIDNANSEMAVINSTSLSAGLYPFRVEVTDVSSGRVGEAKAVLRVIDQCPIGDCSQTGTSGIPQSVNLQADKPQRLPLCPLVGGASSRVDLCSAEDEAASIEVPQGYEVRLGQRSADRSWESGQFASSLAVSDMARDTYTPISFMVDFEVFGLANPSESVPVVVPLPVGASIVEGSVWRKYLEGRWVTFFENDSNTLDSAMRNAIGQCPSVLSDAWQPGLNVGDECIRLTIEDGGPNDADGAADGVITDPGVLAIPSRDTVKATSRGGALNPGLLMLAVLLLLLGRRSFKHKGTVLAWPLLVSLGLGSAWIAEPVFAEQPGTQRLESRVLDTQGNALPQAFVEAIPSVGTLPTLSTYTDNEGRFQLDLVRGVTYTISVFKESEDGSVIYHPTTTTFTPQLLETERSEVVTGDLRERQPWRPQWYLGAQGYWVQTGVTASDIQKNMDDNNIDGEASLDRSGRPGGRLFAGLWLHEHLSLELAWLEWASLGVEIDQALLSLEAKDLRDVLPVTGRGAELSVLGHYPVWNDFSAYGRLGWMALFHEIELTFSDGATSKDERWVNALSLGGGINYQWREAIGLRLGGDWYNTPNYGSYGVGVGVHYTFQ